MRTHPLNAVDAAFRTEWPKLVATVVRDVGDLGPGRPRVVDHGPQHLRGRDDGLGRGVGPADDHLLGPRHFLQWNLHPQVPARDHDAAGLGQKTGSTVPIQFGDLDLVDIFFDHPQQPVKNRE